MHSLWTFNIVWILFHYSLKFILQVLEIENTSDLVQKFFLRFETPVSFNDFNINITLDSVEVLDSLLLSIVGQLELMIKQVGHEVCLLDSLIWSVLNINEPWLEGGVNDKVQGEELVSSGVLIEFGFLREDDLSSSFFNKFLSGIDESVRVTFDVWVFSSSFVQVGLECFNIQDRIDE